MILHCGRKEGQTGRECSHFLGESVYLLQNCLGFTVRPILWTCNGALRSLGEVGAVFAVCSAVHRERKNSHLSAGSYVKG